MLVGPMRLVGIDTPQSPNREVERKGGKRAISDTLITSSFPDLSVLSRCLHLAWCCLVTEPAVLNAVCSCCPETSVGDAKILRHDCKILKVEARQCQKGTGRETKK